MNAAVLVGQPAADMRWPLASVEMLHLFTWHKHTVLHTFFLTHKKFGCTDVLHTFFLTVRRLYTKMPLHPEAATQIYV